MDDYDYIRGLDHNRDGRINARDFDYNGDGYFDSVEQELALREMEMNELDNIQDQIDYDRETRRMEREQNFIDGLIDQAYEHQENEDYLDRMEAVERYSRGRW